MMDTYSNRRTEGRVIKNLDHGVLYEGGMGHGTFPEMVDVVKVGDTVTIETKGFSQVTGIMFEGRWLFHKSDEDMDREHQEFMEKLARDRQESLDKNRADWQARTDALPDWIRSRIVRFQQSRDFELEGWGYELCVCELAVIYAEHGLKDSNDDYSRVENHPSWDYAHKHGTSGNQHGFAKALARGYLSGEMDDAGGTVSALSPITGDAFYEGTNK